MSHLSIASKAEPNLTPLLDVVLQLLMFFIMVTRFVSMEQNPEENADRAAILLPLAQSAKPVDKVDGDPLFLNLTEVEDREGNWAPRVVVWGEQKTLEQARGWLRDQYDIAEKAGQPRTTVILRAHRKLKWKTVKQLLDYCQQAGFRDVRVRAEANLG
jgi:biopolymer transport protein ExbD